MEGQTHFIRGSRIVRGKEPEEKIRVPGWTIGKIPSIGFTNVEINLGNRGAMDEEF